MPILQKKWARGLLQYRFFLHTYSYIMVVPWLSAGEAHCHPSVAPQCRVPKAAAGTGTPTRNSLPCQTSPPRTLQADALAPGAFPDRQPTAPSWATCTRWAYTKMSIKPVARIGRVALSKRLILVQHLQTNCVTTQTSRDLKCAQHMETPTSWSKSLWSQCPITACRPRTWQHLGPHCCHFVVEQCHGPSDDKVACEAHSISSLLALSLATASAVWKQTRTRPFGLETAWNALAPSWSRDEGNVARAMWSACNCNSPNKHVTTVRENWKKALNISIRKILKTSSHKYQKRSLSIFFSPESGRNQKIIDQTLWQPLCCIQRATLSPMTFHDVSLQNPPVLASPEAVRKHTRRPPLPSAAIGCQRPNLILKW